MTQRLNAVVVACAHRFFVGRSNDPATINALCWHTNAKLSTPSPTKSVEDLTIDVEAICSRPPFSAIEVDTGAAAKDKIEPE